MRCDTVGAHLHYSTCKAQGIEDKQVKHTHPSQCVNMKMRLCYGING